MTKYGIISDIHKYPDKIITALALFKSEGVEKLILNGDIGDDEKSIELVLEAAGKSELETFVQPGSHEEVVAYSLVLDSLSSKYSNLVDCVQNRKHEAKDHNLVFLPGSDFNAGNGQYAIGDFDETFNDGLVYRTMLQGQPALATLDPAISESRSELLSRIKAEGKSRYLTHLTNLKYLNGYVSEPEKTILFCHVPIKFDNLEVGVDMAHFCSIYQLLQTQQGFALVETGVVPAVMKDRLKLQGIYVVDMARHNNDSDKIKEIASATVELGVYEFLIEQMGNRGNEDIRKVVEELGIKKYVNGHLHESAGRAHNLKCERVPPGQFTDELFWNASYLDGGRIGTLVIEDNKVLYLDTIFLH